MNADCLNNSNNDWSRWYTKIRLCSTIDIGFSQCIIILFVFVSVMQWRIVSTVIYFQIFIGYSWSTSRMKFGYPLSFLPRFLKSQSQMFIYLCNDLTMVYNDLAVCPLQGVPCNGIFMCPLQWYIHVSLAMVYSCVPCSGIFMCPLQWYIHSRIYASHDYAC